MTSARKPDFASRLLAWREAKGLGRHQAAIELGVPKRTLQQWEQRRRAPLLSSAEPILARLEKDGF